MPFSSSSIIKPTNLSLSSLNPTRHSLPLNRYSPSVPNARTPAPIRLSLVRRSGDNRIIKSRLLAFTEPDHDGISGGGDGENGGGENGGGGNGGDENGRDEAGENNKAEAMMVLAKMGREMESLPADLAAAIVAGKIPKVVVERFFELEKSGMMKWLLQFAGFRERLLADDLFFAKVFIECGVGMFTKTAAEYQKRKENFFNELEVVFADVEEVFTRSERFITAVDVLNGPVFIVDCLLQVMAVIADFMLVYLPAPTVALRPPLNVNAGSFAKFFYSCPDNAFQVALAGTSYSFVQRFGAVVRNGAKLFAVGTASSLVGTAVTNTLINAKKAVDKSGAAEEVENIPVLATSAAYGVYMSVSSNLRYQLLAGVIEQRILEPALHQHKLLLSAVCFAVRTGNTFLGSLLWVDYARLIGLQKPHEADSTHSTA